MRNTSPLLQKETPATAIKAAVIGEWLIAYFFLLFFSWACAAANLAIGTLNGEQLT